MLFRFEITLRKAPCKWTAGGLSLPESCRLPSFGALAGRSVYAEVRMAWCTDGIGLHVKVNGKRQLPWCRETRLDESDGFHCWVDTRCSPGIHRATQYCHRFLWMPSGGGQNREKPVAALVPINRARANPKPILPEAIETGRPCPSRRIRVVGLIPAAAMTGFDPNQQARIGIYYAVIDRELGWQTLSLGPEYPVTDDPSLWGEAVLDGAK